MDNFKGKQFEKEVIIVAVGYNLRYSLSYRERQEMLMERDIEVCHITIYRNVFIIWYASYEAAQHQEDKFYMGQSLVDDKDGFHLPTDEVESVVAKFFNVSPDVLRTDDLYNADDKVYTTSTALVLCQS